MQSSVLSTGILPAELIYTDGKAYEFSALSSPITRHGSQLIWVGIGTDYLVPRRNCNMSIPGSNLPSLKMKDAPKIHEESIIFGFNFAYQLILDNINKFFHLMHRYDCFIKSRLILRSTEEYYRIIDELLAPKLVKSFDEWDAKKSELINALGKCFDPELTFLIQNTEQQLSGLDIPYFTIEIAPAETHYMDRLTSVIDVMSESDRLYQSKLLSKALKL